MVEVQASPVGKVATIWRYPVKSMLGEEAGDACVTSRGILGDRGFALVDGETGHVASAKNPRRWPRLFEFRAAFVSPPIEGTALPAARITFPDGVTLNTDHPDIETRLSAAVGRTVRLAHAPKAEDIVEGYWPDHDWLENPDQDFEFSPAPGTFFDGSMIHLLTTATLARLGELAPESQFDVRRFRPNFVIEPVDGGVGFLENAWIGRTLQIGSVGLRIDRPCPRCVMTMLSQGDLPKDPNVLRTAVRHNAANVGVYASVIQGGVVRAGDEVSLS